MRSRRSILSPANLLCALFGISNLLPSAPARADDYSLPGAGQAAMPDFDQRRQPGPLVFDGQSWFAVPPGLPNNGAMYCVPTASIDVMAYITHHGFPDAMPGGPADWRQQAQYDPVTMALQQMGVLMDTHPVDGTLGNGRSGTQEWVDQHLGPDVLTVDSKYAKKSYAPNVWEIANAALDGKIVIMNVGWYATQAGGQRIRVGGHQTVVTQLFEGMGYFVDGCRVAFRDPGSGGDSWQTQSSFVNRFSTVDYEFGTFSDSSDDVDYYSRTQARLIGYGNTNQGFIQGYYTVSGVFGVGPNGPSLDIYNPYGFTFDPNPQFQSLPSTDGLQIQAVAIHPSKRYVYYTVKDASGAQIPGVRCVEKGTGATTVPLPTLNPTRFVFNGGSLFYSVTGPCLEARDVDAGGALVGSQCLTLPIDDVAYDNVHNRVLAISVAQASALIAAEDLETSEVLPLPSSIALPGQVFLTSCPKSGDFWVRGSDSSTVYRLHYEPGTTAPGTGGSSPGSLTVVESFSDPELIGAIGLDATLGERLYWTRGGVVRLHARNATGVYVESTDSPFAGALVNGPFVLSRPTDNTDLEYRMDSSNRNILPDLTDLFVRGDSNGDSFFDIADAIATLSFLFSSATPPQCADAFDANDDGALDIADAIYSLGALFSGGTLPSAPFEECGEDQTTDALDCATGTCTP